MTLFSISLRTFHVSSPICQISYEPSERPKGSAGIYYTIFCTIIIYDSRYPTVSGINIVSHSNNYMSSRLVVSYYNIYA